MPKPDAPTGPANPDPEDIIEAAAAKVNDPGRAHEKGYTAKPPSEERQDETQPPGGIEPYRVQE